MTISELNGKYTWAELGAMPGDITLRFQLLSPLFRNLYDNKVVYHERFTCIIKLEDIQISPERFSATAVRHLVIRPFMHFEVPERWEIGARWDFLGLSTDLLSVYSSWLMWPDPELVKRVEQLVLDNKFDEAIGLTIGKHS